MTELLYLEDLEVGQIFHSGEHALDAEQIKKFATSFDPQPFHLDEAAAERSFFKGLAASGWHTASLTMSLIVKGGLPISGGLIGAGADLNWPRATRADDILKVETEITKIVPSRSRADRGMITVHCRTINQRGELLQTMTSRMVVFRRGARGDF